MSIAAGQIVFADDIRPLGAKAFGHRPSTKATADNTTEVGVLRIDNVDLEAGHLYKIYTQAIRCSSVSGTHWASRMRWTDTGVAATTSATELAKAESSTTTDSYGPLIAWVVPGSDVDGSFLLTLNRVSGTTVVTMQADGASGIFIIVEDLGVAPADTGVDI